MAKILVVDDMVGIRRSLSVILSGCGHSVIEAENGKDAMKMIDDEGGIDLIITDILMPEADGIELMTKLQSNENKSKLIAISGGGNKVTAENAIEIAKGFADSVLRKPFQRDELIAAVDKALAD